MDQNKHKHFMTPQAKELFDLLMQNGVKVIYEFWDGHKHVDIAIPDAHIFIEVDGIQHYTNPDQIMRDFERTHYSDTSDFDTIHIPNVIIEKHLQEVAEAIIQVVTKRIIRIV